MQHKRNSSFRMACCLAVGVLASVSALAENNTINCQTGSPAMPLDRFRTVAGQGTFEMWSPNLEPADPLGQPLPANRDSTEYSSDDDQLPGAGGLELFYGLDIEPDGSSVYLYMAFNSGFQIWDITGNNATDPVLRSTRNGWFNGFHVFPDPPTEYYLPIWDIDAIDPVGAPGDTLVAVSGDGEVGPTIWDASNKSSPFQLYQDTGKVGVQVVTANIGSRTYALYAVNNGVHVYDMTRAREVGPCFENTSTATSLCGGATNPVWRGRIGPWPWGRARYVDLLEADVSGQPRFIIAASDGTPASPLGVELREITDITSLPPTSVARVEGLSSISFGVDLFEIASRYYLAAINEKDLEIHDVTNCVTGSPGCTLNNPRFDLPTASTLPHSSFVQFSESNGRPFLYKSYHSLCSGPSSTAEPNQEILLELSGLATGGPVVDIRGEQYLDPNHSGPQRRIDYWSSYSDRSTGGFSFFAAHSGRFYGDYFYRGAQTMFDIHRWIDPSAQIETSSDDRWLSSASPDVPEWISLTGSCDSAVASNWQWMAANAAGTAADDPQPIIEPLAGDQARIRADLCGADTYPTSTCPMRTIQVSASVDCGGLATSTNQLSLIVEDPRPFFEAFDILENPREEGPPPVYEVGQDLNLQAVNNGSPGIGGKPATSFEWTVVQVDGDDPPLTCTATGAGTGLVCGETGLSWDTAGIDPDPSVIFLDGFESGDMSAWGGAIRGARGLFDVTLTVTNEHGTFQKTTQVVLLD